MLPAQRLNAHSTHLLFKQRNKFETNERKDDEEQHINLVQKNVWISEANTKTNKPKKGKKDVNKLRKENKLCRMGKEL